MEGQDLLVKLHPEIKEISFRHKSIIQRVFKKKILGILNTDYFSLMIVDSAHTISIYSSDPALEYIWIANNFWEHDGIFEKQNQIEGNFVFWDELYADNSKRILISEKEEKFGFCFGFFIMKKINNVFAIYSFATKTQNDRALYRNSREMLATIGDYFYAELKDIHRLYIVNQNTAITERNGLLKNLKLIVDNTRRS